MLKKACFIFPSAEKPTVAVSQDLLYCQRWQPDSPSLLWHILAWKIKKNNPSYILDQLPHLPSLWGDVFMAIWGMPENWASRAMLLCMLTSCRTRCQQVYLTIASRLLHSFSSWPTQRLTTFACTGFCVSPSGGGLQGGLVNWALCIGDDTQGWQCEITLRYLCWFCFCMLSSLFS